MLAKEDEMTTPTSNHDDESGAPDRPCATCGHPGHAHLVREVEVPGRVIQETHCTECDAACEFVPAPDE